MHEASASCKDIARAPITSREPPMCNARRILLRHEPRNESSARNSISFQSLATIQLYGSW